MYHLANQRMEIHGRQRSPTYAQGEHFPNVISRLSIIYI